MTESQSQRNDSIAQLDDFSQHFLLGYIGNDRNYPDLRFQQEYSTIFGYKQQWSECPDMKIFIDQQKLTPDVAAQGYKPRRV
jgi:hypothetical protein